ncbi:MAG: DNA-binding response regulator [Planctomycetaceae bacterium TMED10]|nr:MAG: DNA-binding response regulator [Planctomycetaceae bacterium TMED10]
MAIRVLIADDHEVVRVGLRSMLNGADVTVVADASSGAETLAAVEQHGHELDLVLLDVRMPDGDGLKTLNLLKDTHPDLPILMISTFDNATYMARSVALGANGYVLKGVDQPVLLDMIRKAASGEMVWRREELRRVTGALSTPRMPIDVEVTLTQRENEVLHQLAHGLTNKQIAEVLSISYETVKEHVQHILRKIGVSDRTQAAVWAVRQGLV